MSCKCAKFHSFIIKGTIFTPNCWTIKATMRKAVQTLSSAKASFCRREAGEREKESARGTMGRGKIYERLREASVLSLFPSSPARLLFFHYCYLYWDTALSSAEAPTGWVPLNLVWNRPTSFPFLV